MQQNKISKFTLQRLPTYLMYLNSLSDDGHATISASVIAAALDLGEVQVRKDLAAVSVAGKPKVGYLVSDLKHDLEVFLGYGSRQRAVLAGAGGLGLALLKYKGFAGYGLEIAAAFEQDSALIGTSIDGIPVLPAEEMEEFCRREGIRIGILAVPESAAQACMDAMVSGGVRAVWNFAPVHLSAPEGVLVQREDMSASLALLTYHLRQE